MQSINSLSGTNKTTNFKCAKKKAATKVINKTDLNKLHSLADSYRCTYQGSMRSVLNDKIASLNDFPAIMNKEVQAEIQRLYEIMNYFS